MESSLSAIVPTSEQIAYTPPTVSALLSISAYLVLLALPTLLSNAYPHPPNGSLEPTSRQYGRSADGDSNLQRSPSIHALSSTKSPVSYSLNAASTLLLPLLTGALFGPSITSTSILSTSTQRTLIDIGYIGLILLIFEAGLSLDAASFKLMRNNAGLSAVVAVTGVLMPIALSMALGIGAYGYGVLKAFASGAALSSTSLGTTLALLTSSGSSAQQANTGINLKRTRVGCVLVCAALLDDILGLVIAGIIPGLADQQSSGDATDIQWPTIVRPILVSLGFGLGTPALAMGLKKIMKTCVTSDLPGLVQKVSRPFKTNSTGQETANNDRHATATSTVSLAPSEYSPPPHQSLCIILILTLVAFVSGSGYAGTSELFGAYLAGAAVSHIFGQDTKMISGPDDVSLSESQNRAHEAFTHYLQPVLTHLLVPIFFASIGTALPIKAMFATHPDAVQVVIVTGNNTATTTIHINQGKASHRIIWRGLLYALLMVLAKMVVGLWIFVWPTRNVDNGSKTKRQWKVVSRLKPWSTQLFREHLRDTRIQGAEIERGQSRLGKILGQLVWRMPLRLSSSNSETDLRLSPVDKKGKSADSTTPTPPQNEVDSKFGNRDSGVEESGPSTSASMTCRALSSIPAHSGSHVTDVNPGQQALQVQDVNQTRREPPSDVSSPPSDKTAESDSTEPSRMRSALLLGIAMVARGEIALIIAQLARPLLVDSSAASTTSTSVIDSSIVASTTTTPIADEEAFVVVIWAVLISTIGGALGVSVLLASWRKRDEQKSRNRSGASGEHVDFL